MRDAGLTHLTAVSGANCAILLALVHWLGGWLHVPRTARALVSLGVLVAFVVVVGPQPSVLRASVMAGLTLGAGLIGGRRAAAHVLQVSAVVLLLVDPWLAYSVGFMLSIAATAGLIALIDRGPLAATMAAQVATFPILLAIGGAVGPRTVVANVVVAPLAAVVPVLGLMSVVGQWWGGWGALPAMVGRTATSLILRVAGWDALPALTWVPGWAGVLLAILVSAVVFGLARQHLVVVAVALVTVIGSTVRLADGWPPKGWWIVACDVGQGDAFVARSHGAVVVIDAGQEPDRVDACLDRLGVRRVDLLVLTHFHADHVGGLAGVFRRPVGQVWISPCQEPAEQYAQAQRWLGQVPVSVPLPTATATVGDMRLSVVWPERVIHAGSVPNNASVSFLLTTPGPSAAFFGDVEPEAQQAILRGWSVDVDVVKVPHHGSAQFDPRLPSATSPRIALIGVGEDNTFGHPTPEAVVAWQQAGAAVYTTAQNGDIAVTEDLEVQVRGPQSAPLG
jgi:competence protein ComEC